MTNTWHSHYQPPKQELWQGRMDSFPGERFFQIIQCLDATKVNRVPLGSQMAFGLVGFCCDAGVRRNLGRPGAAQGPAAFRTALAKQPLSSAAIQIYDLGDIVCHDDDLENAQNSLAELVALLISNNIQPIVIGGGHETAWGHYQGLIKANPTLDVGIINFDAHFDLRPLLECGKGSSGTPFQQIALDCQTRQRNFSYFCLGIQQLANTKSLFATAKELKVNYISAETMHLQPITNYLPLLDQFIRAHQAIYLSICLDVFANCVAPGVSAPQALGLFPWQVIPIIRHIVQTKKMIGFDIVELSPPLDQNGMTAQLAANLAADAMERFKF